MPLDPQIAPLLDMIATGTPIAEMDVPGARDSFRTLTVHLRPAETVIPVAAVEDTEVAGAEGPLRARVYRPEKEGPVPTVALFHGGGFVIGDLDTHDNMARAICVGAGAVVVSVDYRLAPEHPFPAAPLDAIAATRDIASRLGELGGSESLGVAGDSAGGNLAAVVAQQVPGIRAQLLVYPATDGGGTHTSHTENAKGYFLEAETIAWFMGHYVPEGTSVTDPLIAPLHGELEGIAPAVIVTAELDPLRDEGIAYADALAAAGVPVQHTTYPGLIHGFFDLDAFSSASQAAIVETIGKFGDLL
ncbi:MAG TPA: alpha/beta hydrolase [Nocardioides sp.]|nr:alpha/beta hydrolase [Nocardioides sp.]